MPPLFRTLRFRLLLLVGFALVPVAALVLNNAAAERTIARETTEERALLVTRAAASDYALFVEASRDMLGLFAQDLLASIDGGGDCSTTLTNHAAIMPFYRGLSVYDRSSNELCSAQPPSPRIDLTGDNVRERTIESRTLTLGQFQIDREGHPVQMSGFPIIDPFGAVRGVMVVALDLIAISRVLPPANLPAGSIFSVLDPSGVVVINYPDPEQWIGRTVADEQLIEAVRARGTEPMETFDLDGVRRLSAVYPLVGPWEGGSVVIGIPTSVAYAEANARLSHSLLSLAAVAVAALAAVWFGGEALLVRRVRALIATTRELASGNLAARSGRSNDRGELGALAVAVDDMARALQQRDAQLTHQAFHDPVTGLPNRIWFLERLVRALSPTLGSGARVAVLFIDLDNFKVINDSLGHAAGDQLLTALGTRLSSGLKPGQSLARFGGDEFAVLSDYAVTEADIQQQAALLQADLSRPILVEGREIIVTASIGIAVGGPAEADPATLMRHADIAMYQAKLGGKDRTVLFDADMQRGAIERLELESDLRQAVERGQLEVWYQPEIDLGTQRIVGVEALLRWRHPVRGLIAPASFIPLAEETGLIVPIGRWVLVETCRQVKQWQDEHPLEDPLLLSVNLSARQFAEPDLADDVRRALEVTGLQPTSLWLEITETVLMENSPAVDETLRALGALGVRFALDDFGTGYSSLTYLRELPFDMLKIDRSFIANLDEPGTVAIVQTVTALAHSLGMQVTAEGVETSEQLLRTRSIQCDWAQGYHIARPLTPADLERFLAEAELQRLDLRRAV